MSPQVWAARLGLGLAVMAVMSSCSDPEPRQAPAKRPAAFQPESFPDLTLFVLAGYGLAIEPEPLAVSYAGGTLRRVEVAFQTRPGGTAEDPEMPLRRFARELPPLGWVAEPTEGLSQQWHRGHEHLAIQAGRDGDVTTIRLSLAPADPPPVAR